VAGTAVASRRHPPHRLGARVPTVEMPVRGVTALSTSSSFASTPARRAQRPQPRNACCGCDTFRRGGAVAALGVGVAWSSAQRMGMLLSVHRPGWGTPVTKRHTLPSVEPPSAVINASTCPAPEQPPQLPAAQQAQPPPPLPPPPPPPAPHRSSRSPAATRRHRSALC